MVFYPSRHRDRETLLLAGCDTLCASMAWHPIWRTTRKIVDARDRREPSGDSSPRPPDTDESYVVEALEPTEILAIGRPTFERLLERKHFAYKIVTLLEERQVELVRRLLSTG